MYKEGRSQEYPKRNHTGNMATFVIATLGFALMAMGLSMYVQEVNPEYYLIILWSVIGLLGS